HPIGRGGMGEVWSAYDPELDRQVALKLLRPDGAAGGESRLLREAQAMARLAHPNVIAVFEVGSDRGRVFLAMERVEGEDLASWLRTARPWREVLAVFVAAGEGLAAAHRAGLVHRDFKPANVLIGRDGRVRVLDFGLARAAGQPSEAAVAGRPGAGEAVAGEAAGSALASPLTRAGAVMGTPAYMAPEQLSGRADALSDQFGFCAALWEGLYGERPFTDAPFRELLEEPRARRVRPPPAGTRVPAWLRQRLLRGLAADPDERYPSMTALLAALADDPHVRRRRWLAAAAAVLLVAVGVAGAGGWIEARSAVCGGAGERLAGTWDDGRRRAVTAAFAALGAGGREVGERTVRALDRYATAWATQRTAACEATRLRGEQSEALLDLRIACLDRRLDELDALAGLLLTAGPEALRQAPQAAASLPPLANCSEVTLLTAPLPPPRQREAARRASAVERQLAAARALRDTGQEPLALDAARAAREEAERLAHPPLVAEARQAVGDLEERMGDFAAAAETLFAALVAAQEGRHDEVVARTLADLVWVSGYDLARYDEAHRWAELGEATLDRLGGAPALAGELHNAVGSVLMQEGRYDEAAAALERAIAAFGRVYGTGHYQTAKALNNLANVRHSQGRLAEALELQERVVALFTTELGGEHAITAMAHQNLGATLAALGRPDEARRHHQRSYDVRRRLFGEESYWTASALLNLALLDLADETRQQEAVAGLERGLAIYRGTLGEEHPFLAYPLAGLGRAELQGGRPERAVPLLEDALARWEASGVVTRQELGADRFALARALWESGGDRGRSLELARSARQTLAELPEPPPLLADLDAWLAERQAAP
ncbi:MAG TPA: serine/threonine-protein kinase, partial [Thermoanaerobaculia bacterium]